MKSPLPQISDSAQIGLNVRIWAGTQIRENAIVGSGTSIGQYCYVGPGVQIGNNCKIQNHALIYEPAVIESGVFIGPRAVITNDLNPRAINPDGSLKTENDWDARSAHILNGASVGAGVICVGPIVVGAWSMLAAGAIVTKDVPDFALFAGIPARQIGWVGKAGFSLIENEGMFKCPKTGEIYILDEVGRLSLSLESE